MAKKFLVNVDLGGNQLLSARVHNGTSEPTAYGKGQLWFDSTNNQLNVYNGSSFQPLATGGTAVSSLNGLTGGVTIYGTSNQISVSAGSGSITLSLPSTISVTTACATNFYGAFNGNATTVTNGVYTTDTGTVTSTMIADNTIVNSDISSTAAITPNKLSASSITIAGTTVGLGGTLSSIGVNYLSASTVTIGSTAIGLGGTSTTLTGLTNVNSTSFVGTFYGNATTATNATTVTNGVYTTDTGTVTSTMIADGTIVNGDISNNAGITPNKLSASTVTVGSTTIGLGGTSTILSGLSNVNSTSFVGALFGNATTVTNGIYTTDTGTVTSTMIADGTIVNNDISSTAGITPNKLSASTVTIGSTEIGLGGTSATVTGLTSLSATTLNATGSTDSTNTTSGALVVTGGAGIAKNLYVGGNLDVSGSVYISGSAFTVAASNITLADSLIYLATSNPSNLVDIGIVGHFNDGTYQHTGLVRDATDNVWKLFSGITDEPSTTMNFDQAVYNYLKTGGLYINSNATTTTASISSGGSGYFTGLSISGSAVATEAYVLANSGLGSAQKEAYTIAGDSASTSFVINHTLNTRDVNVQVYQTSATPDTQYAEVEVDIVRTTASAVTISFATAPTTGTTYRVVIVG